MSRVRELFDERLDRLRQRAAEEGVSFIHLLSALTEAPSNAGLSLLSMSKSAGLEQKKCDEKQMIEEYRIRFYEDMANIGLQFQDLAINMRNETIKAALKNAKRVRRAQEGPSTGRGAIFGSG